MSGLFDFTIFGYPFLHAAPLIVFGPVFIFLFYYFGYKELFKKLTPFRKEVSQKPLIISKKSPLKWFVQALAYLAFAFGIAYFSSSHGYDILNPDQAVIKLSFTHPGQRKEKCRRRTPQELAKLPANMRAPQSCARERWPVKIELTLDDTIILSETRAPRGLSNDGPSSIYRRFQVPSGPHRLRVRIKDRGQGNDYNYTLDQTVDLRAMKVTVIGFDSIKKKIFIKQ